MLADLMERVADVLGAKGAGKPVADAVRETGTVLMAHTGLNGVANLAENYVANNLGESMSTGNSIPALGAGKGAGVGGP